MKIVYTVELKDWEHEDNYPQLYKGNNMLIALNHFRKAHLENKDVIMFIEDENGYQVSEPIENYGTYNNIELCHIIFPQSDNNLVKKANEEKKNCDVYQEWYNNQLKENDKLKKQNEYLQHENIAMRQQLKEKQQTESKQDQTYTYAFRLRGFSPYCQPMNGLVSHNDNVGRWGTITYNRPLTDEEIAKYELMKA